MNGSAIAVGLISQESQIAFEVLLNQTERIPPETAPVTSNGFLEISHDLEATDSVLR